MKSAFRLVALALAFCLLCGCAVLPQSGEKTNETAATDPPRNINQGSRDTFRGFGLSYVEEYGFNPYQCNCITNRPVLSLVYESLFVLGSGYQPEPVLCDQFAVSEDGLTYRLTLCPGVTFSDGSPLTAADVAASLNAARDSDYYGSRFSKVASFNDLDDDTLEILLLRAYENLPAILDVPIVKADTVSEDRPLGSGPYAFSQEEGALRLRRNRNWWQKERAPVEYDTILLTAANDPSQVRDSFEFGSTSLVCADLNAPNAVGFRCDYELWDCPTTIMQYLGFNLGSGIFTDRTFRASVTHIIDRETLTSSVYKGFAQAAYLPCAPDSPYYDTDLAETYSYDEELYRQARAGVTISGDYDATLLVCSADPARVETAHRIAEMLTAAGTRMEVKAVDQDTYRYRLSSGQYDMFIGETRLSGNFDLTEFFRPYGNLCYGGIQSAGMEQLCYDSLENSGNCYDLYQSVMENAYICPLLFKSYAVMANRGVIGNLQPAVDNVFHLPGGRSLSAANISYAEMTGQVEETEEVPTEEQGNPDTEENP